MEEVLKSKNKLGEVLEAYQRIAVALNTFEEGKEFSIKELADRAEVHWVTAKKALFFFDNIKMLIPTFELQRDTKFKVTAKPNAFEAVDGLFSSLEMRVLTKMMLCKAMSPESARSMNEILKSQEFEVLPKLISKGFVNSFEGLYYLSRKGTALGGLGLKKIIDSGISLKWQKMRVVMPAIRLPPLAIGSVEAIEKPDYLYRRHEDFRLYDQEGWKFSFEKGRA